MTRAGSWIAWRDSNRLSHPRPFAKPLQATGRINQRSCTLTHEVVCWVVLAMGLLTDLPIRQVFKHARRLRFGEETPHRSSLCVARQRLGIAPVRHLFEQIVHPLARPETPGAFYRGFRLMGIDGVVFDVPDSDANAAAFGRPSAGPRGDGAFPQVRKLSLVELGTHVEFAFVVRSHHPRRTVDGRRPAPPSDCRDAPAVGSRLLQLWPLEGGELRGA